MTYTSNTSSKCMFHRNVYIGTRSAIKISYKCHFIHIVTLLNCLTLTSITLMIPVLASIVSRKLQSPYNLVIKGSLVGVQSLDHCMGSLVKFEISWPKYKLRCFAWVQERNWR